MAKFLKAALLYGEMGYSVIPCRKDKKPFVAWTAFQTNAPEPEQIKAWWSKWPDANPAIVTGEISGIDVLDADSETGKKAVEDFLPDSLLIPTVRTPKGYHFYFKHSPGLQNGTRIIADCDLRTSGGYVLAPPGYNQAGQYKWANGLKITNIDPPEMPQMLFEVLKNGGRDSGASSSEHIKIDSIPIDKNSLSREGATFQKTQTATSATNRNKRNMSFNEPGRDETLFHIATSLTRGGMEIDNIRECLDFFGANCSPPFPKKEIEAKIQSALNRIENRKGNLTAEIREWVSATWGNITATEAQQTATSATFADRKKIRVILGRLVNEGILERVPEKNGVYRKIDTDCQIMDWANADTEFLDFWLPYDLTEIAGVQPGNVLIFAGEKDSGKTAALMNIAKENRHNFKVHYFSSEMGAAEFKLRANKFDITPDQWGIKVYEWASNFQDVIKPGEGNLNIIDFLEIYDSFYKIGADIARIHEKLKGAIAVIAIQKSPGQDFGRGGAFSLEKARLYISLFRGRAKCISCKNFREDSPIGNPRGKDYLFKLVDGCRIIKTTGWHMPTNGGKAE